MFLSKVILTKNFDRTPTCKTKGNQSEKIKNILIAEMTNVC